MGDTLLSQDDIIQSNKRRQSESSISSTSQKPGKSELKKHVTFLPDETLVQIHEISPRSIKSHDSNDSSDSPDSSSESDSDSETDSSTSSSDTSSEESTHTLRKSQIEARPTATRSKSLSTTFKMSSLGLISKPTLDHKTNKQLSVKFNQSTQANKNEGATNKSKSTLLTAAHQTLTKTRSLFTRANTTLGVPSAAPTKVVNFDNIARRSSFPVKKRPLLPARNATSARRRSEGSVMPPAVDSALNLQALQTNETFATLSKSLQSLTIEDAFIFPSIQTYDLKLPTLKQHPNDTQVTHHSDGRNFETSPPKSASGEQKMLKPTLQGSRHSAWQMANGRAEDTLETKPNIAQLWEFSQAWPEF